MCYGECVKSPLIWFQHENIFIFLILMLICVSGHRPSASAAAKHCKFKRADRLPAACRSSFSSNLIPLALDLAVVCTLFFEEDIVWGDFITTCTISTDMAETCQFLLFSYMSSLKVKYRFIQSGCRSHVLVHSGTNVHKEQKVLIFGPREILR